MLEVIYIEQVVPLQRTHGVGVISEHLRSTEVVVGFSIEVCDCVNTQVSGMSLVAIRVV